MEEWSLQLLVFLTSRVDGSEWSVSCSGRFTSLCIW